MMFLYDLINKDVKYENETKKVMVALRMIYLAVLAAFIADVAICGRTILDRYWVRLVVLLSLNIILFLLTYRLRTKIALWGFMTFMFAWIYMMIPAVGWSAGIQNYFIIMLLMIFFGLYEKNIYKILFSILILVARILVIINVGLITADYVTSTKSKAMQIVNIAIVFILIIYIAAVFSKADKEGEGKLVKYNEKLKNEAFTDQLTGLFNRRKAEEYLKAVIDAPHEEGVSVCIGDIDFFKKVNDNFGHDAGDEVLKMIAKLMMDTLRSDSFIARWGGEEFLIVLPECNGDQAVIALERLRRIIENNTMKVGDNEIKVTMTFGVSEYDFSGDMDSVIKEADERLYYGKQNGRNKVVF